MKTYFVAATAILLTLTACNNSELTVSNVLHESKMDSLNAIITSRDSVINDFLSSFDDIEKNLDSVTAKQNIISMNVDKQRGEIRNNVKERINAQIAAINSLMEESQKKIGELNQKVKRYSFKINQFNKLINTLNEQVAQKNNELQQLNEKLNEANAQVAQLRTTVDTLSSQNSSQSALIASQTESMHTAYYVVGASKELVEKKVIDKTGGLLGIGKTSKLNPDIDPANFTRIDYTRVQEIPINSKKAKVITAHPADSYSLEKQNEQITSLKITQPDKFWSTSKYLVVVNN